MTPLIAIVRRLAVVALLLVSPAQLLAQPAAELVKKLQELTRDMKPMQLRPEDDELRKLQIEKYNVALEEVRQELEDFRNNLTTLETVMTSCRQFLQADLDVQSRPEDKIRVLRQALELVKWYEGRLDQAVKDRVGSRADLLRVRYRRLELEADIVKCRREMLNAPGK